MPPSRNRTERESPRFQPSAASPRQGYRQSSQPPVAIMLAHAKGRAALNNEYAPPRPAGLESHRAYPNANPNPGFFPEHAQYMQSPNRDFTPAGHAPSVCPSSVGSYRFPVDTPQHFMTPQATGMSMSTSAASLTPVTPWAPAESSAYSGFARPHNPDPQHFYHAEDEDVEPRQSGEERAKTPDAPPIAHEHSTEFPFPSYIPPNGVTQSTPATDLGNRMAVWNLSTPYNPPNMPGANGRGRNDGVSPPDIELRSPDNVDVPLPDLREESQLFSPIAFAMSSKQRTPRPRKRSRRVRYASDTHGNTPEPEPHEGLEAESIASHTPRSDVATPGTGPSSECPEARDDTRDLFTPDHDLEAWEHAQSPTDMLRVAVRGRSLVRSLTPGYGDGAPHETATVRAPPGHCGDVWGIDWNSLPPEFRMRYRFTVELGAGGYGFVCAGIRSMDATFTYTQDVAIKFIDKQRTSQRDCCVVNEKQVPNEANILSRLNHPNIVRFYDLFWTPTHFIMVQELHGDPWVKPPPILREDPSFTEPPQRFDPLIPTARIGEGPRPRMGRRASYDLFEAVEATRFTEEQAKDIFVQIASAVQYMHERGIYHRDLKDENITIDHDYKIKIIDFGSAVSEAPGTTRWYRTFRGTASYASPELRASKAYLAGPVDMWCLGVLLHILLTGEMPAENTLRSRFRAARRYSEAAANLLDGLLQREPTHRLTAEEVMNHPWTRGVTEYPIERYHRLNPDRPWYNCRAGICYLPHHHPAQAVAAPASPPHHPSTSSGPFAAVMREAQAQMMEAVAIPLYERGANLLSYVTGTATMAWVQSQHNKH